MRTEFDDRTSGLRLRAVLGLSALLLALAFAVLAGGSERAPAQDLQGQLDETQGQLEENRAEQEVLTTDISAYNEDIEQLEGEVAVLRGREAAVEAELAAKQAELERAIAELAAEKDHLVELRRHLTRSLVGLRERLVAMYQEGVPDTWEVILSADGFDDLIERTEYLKLIQHQDEAVVGRVRDLRNQTKSSVLQLRDVKERIEAARDAIAAKERELERTRLAVEARENELIAARAERQSTLDNLEQQAQALEGDVSALSDQITEQLAGAPGSATPLPSGPTPEPSSEGLIWPIDGILTSPYGYRWGRLHEGIDIGAAEGTPIAAAASGTVLLASYNGGYGNYTCVDHGGGLSTCYAHQSAFATSAGASVSQGDVIGYVGNTGASYGAHLHFEVRIDGASTDPMGYL